MTDIAGETLRDHVLERVDDLSEQLAGMRAELANGAYDDLDGARLGTLTTLLPAVVFVRELMNALLPGLDEDAERMVSIAAAVHPGRQGLDREQRADLAMTGSRLLADIFIAGQLSGQIVPGAGWDLGRLVRAVLDALIEARREQEREDELADSG
jgi:hypothetical protein